MSFFPVVCLDHRSVASGACLAIHRAIPVICLISSSPSKADLVHCAVREKVRAKTWPAICGRGLSRCTGSRCKIRLIKTFKEVA